MTTELEIESDAARFTVPYYVRALALGIPAIMLGFQLSGWLAFVPLVNQGYVDFRHLYTAGYMARTGHAHELYDYHAQKAFQDELVSPFPIATPFIRPAYQALVFAPFSLLGYRAAYYAFLVFNLVLLGIAFRFLRPQMDNLAKVYQWLPAAMVLSFIPVGVALMQGQDSIVLLTLLAGAAAALERDRDWTAGLLVGLGLFKFQIVIPIALLFLIWRRWRFSAGFALSAALAGSVSFWLVGFAESEIYVRSLVSMNLAGIPAVNQFRFPIPRGQMANLSGLIFGLANAHLSEFWMKAGTVAASALVLLLVAAIAHGKQRRADALLIAITASTVVSYYLLLHDLSVLLIPVALTLNRCIGAEATGDMSGRFAARTSALMFIVPASMAFIPSRFYLVSLPLLAFLCAISVASPTYQALSHAGETVR
jgi:hypothetical protein